MYSSGTHSDSLVLLYIGHIRHILDCFEWAYFPIFPHVLDYLSTWFERRCSIDERNMQKRMSPTPSAIKIQDDESMKLVNALVHLCCVLRVLSKVSKLLGHKVLEVGRCPDFVLRIAERLLAAKMLRVDALHLSTRLRAKVPSSPRQSRQSSMYIWYLVQEGRGYFESAFSCRDLICKSLLCPCPHKSNKNLKTEELMQGIQWCMRPTATPTKAGCTIVSKKQPPKTRTAKAKMGRRLPSEP